MIKQNKIKLLFILAGFFMLTFTACNNSGDTKETEKDTTIKIETPPPAVRDSGDTMEVIPGKVAPGNDNKPVTP